MFIVLYCHQMFPRHKLLKRINSLQSPNFINKRRVRYSLKYLHIIRYCLTTTCQQIVHFNQISNFKISPSYTLIQNNKGKLLVFVSNLIILLFVDFTLSSKVLSSYVDATNGRLQYLCQRKDYEQGQIIIMSNMLLHVRVYRALNFQHPNNRQFQVAF